MRNITVPKGEALDEFIIATQKAIRQISARLGHVNKFNFTATRLLATDSSKDFSSVTDLTSWVSGTADEVNVADDGDGTITIGIVDPLIVGKGGTGAATLTDHSLLAGSGTGAITALGAASNGQLPIGSTGNDPALATLTGTSNQITVTNGAGSITLSLPQDYDTGATPTLGGLTIVNAITEFSTDGTLADDSDSALSTEKAVKTYVDTEISGLSSIYQPLDSGLTSLAGLTYASDSFIKVTAEDTYAIRTIAETKTDLSLNLVENTALSTWAGTTNITTLGTIATGTWQATDVGIAYGGTGQSTAQLAINALTAVSGATNEHVLTKDTVTGNAIFKAAAGGGTPGGADTNVQYNNSGAFGGSANFTWDNTNSGLTLTSSVTQKPTINLVNTNADNNAGRLIFTKTSASQADDDYLGFILGYGKDSGGTSTLFTTIGFISEDITDGDEAGSISLRVTVDGAVSQELLGIRGYNGVVGGAELVVNENGLDCDIRVESTSETSAIFFNGATGGFGIGGITTAGDGVNYGRLTVLDSTDVASRGVCSLHTSNDAHGPSISFLKNRGSLTTACQDGDCIGVFPFSFVNSTPEKQIGASFGAFVADVTAGTVDTSIFFNTMINSVWARTIDIVLGGLSMPYVYSDTVGGTNRDLYIDNTGKFGYVSSGLKYKTNIREIDNTDRLYDLHPVRFDRIDGSSKDEMGLIAEEVATVFPEVVSYKRRQIAQELSNDKLIAGKPIFEETNEPETVNYSRLIVPLLKEVQKLRQEIDTLKENN